MANKNFNGLVRQYFPKKTDFSKISSQEVKLVEEILNNRPLKSYNYSSQLDILINKINQTNISHL